MAEPESEHTELDVGAFARAFVQVSAEVHHVATGAASDLSQAIAQHLGVDPSQLPVIEQAFPAADHPNVQLAMEKIAAGSSGYQLFGLPAEVMHWSGFGLANLASNRTRGPQFDVVAPAYVNVPVGVGRTLPCVSVGVWLLEHEGVPVVALTSLGDPHQGRDGVKIEVLAIERAVGVSFLDTVRCLTDQLSVYRGNVLSFTFSQWGAFGLEFHPLPQVAREDLVLPETDLQAIERHTVDMTRYADRLRAAHRHLKRGLLLYGPPGTGKTFSVMYLCSRMPERTTILLSGQAGERLGQAAAMARSLQPSMLVLEDVDLVAMERTMPGAESNPVLFQLLNEMDGLDEDADVIFVLTTNRVDLLEPALASRPGRIDQAVEICLPDEECRRRLLDRYLGDLELQDVDLAEMVHRTAGVSAAFLKELGRRAILIGADAHAGDRPLVVGRDHVIEALDDLLEHSDPVLRSSLGVASPGGRGRV